MSLVYHSLWSIRFGVFVYYGMLNPRARGRTACKDVPTRTNSSSEWPAACIFMRGGWYLVFISVETYWDDDKLARVYWACTRNSATTLESTKRRGGDDPRASQTLPQPDKSASLCTFCIIPHDHSAKWPAWSPWISMSRVLGRVNSAQFDACRLKGRGRGTHRADSASLGVHAASKSHARITLRDGTEIGGSSHRRGAPSPSQAARSLSLPRENNR